MRRKLSQAEHKERAQKWAVHKKKIYDVYEKGKAIDCLEVAKTSAKVLPLLLY